MAGVPSMSQELVVQKSIVHIDKEDLGAKWSQALVNHGWYSMSSLPTQISKELVKLSLILGANRRFSGFV